MATVTCLVCRWAFKISIDNETDRITRMTETAYCPKCSLLCIMCETKAFVLTNALKLCIQCYEQTNSTYAEDQRGIQVASVNASDQDKDQDEQTASVQSCDNDDDVQEVQYYPNIEYCNIFIPSLCSDEAQLEALYEILNVELHSKYGYTAAINPDDQGLCDFVYIYAKWPEASRFLLKLWKEKIEVSNHVSFCGSNDEVSKTCVLVFE